MRQPPRPYWPQRRGNGLSHDGSTPRDTRRDFARLIGEFADNGYLVEVFGEECVDDHSELPDASEVIDRRLGIPHLWPLTPETWDEDIFYGLIEVFHDLVSRPRTRRFHSCSGCSGQDAVAVTACTLTATWQLARLPRARSTAGPPRPTAGRPWETTHRRPPTPRG